MKYENVALQVQQDAVQAELQKSQNQIHNALYLEKMAKVKIKSL